MGTLEGNLGDVRKLLKYSVISPGTDISKPLKNSLIHTGHGDPGGKSWGCPETIDVFWLFTQVQISVSR